MKKKKITSRPVDSFSVSFAQRKPFDPPPPSAHYCSATTFALFCLNPKTEKQNQPKTLQNDS